MQLLLHSIIVFCMLLATCVLKARADANIAEQKRLLITRRFSSSCRVEDKSGSEGCRVSLAERNIICLSTIDSNFIRRQKLEARQYYLKQLSGAIKKSKQQINSLIAKVRNSIKISQVKFDNIKSTNHVLKVTNNKNIEEDTNNEKLKS